MYLYKNFLFMFNLTIATFLANVNSRPRSLYAIAVPSVVCLSVVCNVRVRQFFLAFYAITPKRCKIGDTLLLITNRKSYMGFRLVSKLVTLNDIERRDGPYFALFYRIW